MGGWCGLEGEGHVHIAMTGVMKGMTGWCSCGKVLWISISTSVCCSVLRALIESMMRVASADLTLGGTGLPSLVPIP